MDTEDAASAGKSSPHRTAVVVVHGVADTRPGETLQILVDGLTAKLAGTGLQRWRYRRHYRLPDVATGPGSGRPNWVQRLLGVKKEPYFNVYAHELRMGDGTEATMHELHWADVRGIRDGAIWTLLGLLRTLFETPHVVDALLLKRRTWFSRALRSLLLVATCFLRGPLAGFSATLFAGGLLFLLYYWIPDREPINAWLFAHGLPWRQTIVAFLPYKPYFIVAITAVGLAGFWLLHTYKDHDIGWADFGLFIGVTSLVIAVHAALQSHIDWSTSGPAHLALFKLYFPLLKFFWIVWAALMGLVVTIYLGMFVKDLVLRNRTEPRGVGAAIALAFVQAFVWLTALPVLGIVHLEMIRGLFVTPTDKDHLEAADSALRVATLQPDRNLFDYIDWQSTLASFGLDSNIRIGLGEITRTFLLNGAFLLGAAMLAFLFGLYRLVYARRSRREPADIAGRMPRLIVNPWVIRLLLVVGIVQAGLLLFKAAGDQTVPVDAPQAPFVIGVWLAGLLLVIGPLLWSVFSAPARGVVHIAQDLIDHHYRPGLGAATLFNPRGSRALQYAHPRRDRIAGRMQTLVDTLIRSGGYDRVLFMAHSQGTVIVYDYLRSVIADGGMLGKFKPDVITLGSPLSHLYAHYFDEYREVPDDLEDLRPTVGRWLNLYRCDDAIGGPIGDPSNTLVENRALPHGGHLNYWANDDVVKAIEELLCAPVAISTPQPGVRSATAAGSPGSGLAAFAAALSTQGLSRRLARAADRSRGRRGPA